MNKPVLPGKLSIFLCVLPAMVSFRQGRNQAGILVMRCVAAAALSGATSQFDSGARRKYIAAACGLLIARIKGGAIRLLVFLSFPAEHYLWH